MPHTTELTTNQKLLDLLGITHALTAEVNLDVLLVKIMDASTRLLEAERSTLYLIDWTTGELVSKIAQRAEVREIRLPIGVGLAGHVAATGEMLVVPDAHRDPRFNPAFDTRTGFRTRDVLVLPMLNRRQERIGVIQVMNSRNGRFGPSDIALLQALASSAGVALENARLYERIDAMLESFIRTLAASIDARDPQTAGHSLRVAGYAAQLVRQFGVAARQQKLVYLAGLLHDYGKIGVPEAILTKPARLSDEEMGIMREHASMSRGILANVQFTDELTRIPEIVYQHHERMDGRGYPRGLRGSEISFEGRILAVCDVFDALTQRRYYREPISHAEAFDYIADNRGTQFDPDVVDALRAILRRDGKATESHPVHVPTAGESPPEEQKIEQLSRLGMLESLNV
jgi:HD-GYP domain-containing protein (c-di-GMP phosphodiesterase class II)